MSKADSEIILDVDLKIESYNIEDDSNVHEIEDEQIIDFDEEVRIDKDDANIDEKENNEHYLNNENIETNNLPNNKYTKPVYNAESPENKLKIDKSMKWEEISDINKVEVLDSPEKKAKIRVSKTPISNLIGNHTSTDRTNTLKGFSMQVGNDGKSVLSKISEDFRNSHSNKKISIYESLLHDEYIKRFNDKNKIDNSKKTNNFISRNQDFKQNKQHRLHEKTEIARQEFIKNCHGMPNNKELTRSDIRKHSEFINDQKSFFDQKERNLNELKKSYLEKDFKNYKKTPLSIKSKALAEKKNKLRETDIHKRLYSEKLDKMKSILLQTNNKKISKLKNLFDLEPSSRNKIKIKRTNSEIMIKVDRLHAVSKEKLAKFEEYQRITLQSFNIEHDLMSQTSKKLILSQLDKKFQANVINYITKDSRSLNFEQFIQILFDINFTLFDPKITLEDKNDINKQKNELKLIHEAWKLLTGVDKIGSLDSNKLFVFCAAVLGLYKGQLIQEGENVKVDNKINLKSSLKSISPKKISARKVIKEENIVKTVSSVNFGDHGFTNEFNKHLKISFRYFCENWIDHLMQEKNKHYASRLISNNKDLVFKPCLSPQSYSLAKNNRKKCIYKVESENKNHSTRQKMKVEDAYVLHLKKREQEIARLKHEKEEEIMKPCTFQPNIDIRDKSQNIKSSNDIGKKLYDDAFLKNNQGLITCKNKIDSSKLELNTFTPKLNKYKSSIFSKNPLENDKFIKKHCEQKERARIEKKIIDIQMKKGMNNIRNFKYIDELLKEEIETDFKFTLETKCNKDTFDTRKLLNQNHFSSPKSLSTSTNTLIPKPIILLSINIDDNKQEKLEIFSKDDPKIVAQNFSKKHNLNDLKREFLQKLIEDKINNHLIIKS